MDQLAKDMIQCKADGYGCHYGAWHAEVKEPQMAAPAERYPKKKLTGDQKKLRYCVICDKQIPPSAHARSKTCGPICADKLRLHRAKETRERRKLQEQQLIV